MFRFPFYGYPYNYPYYRYYSIYSNNNVQQSEIKKEEKKDSITNSNEVSNTTNSRFNSNNEPNIFEIFGIKLYLLIQYSSISFIKEYVLKSVLLHLTVHRIPSHTQILWRRFPVRQRFHCCRNQDQ